MYYHPAITYSIGVVKHSMLHACWSEIFCWHSPSYLVAMQTVLHAFPSVCIVYSGTKYRLKNERIFESNNYRSVFIGCLFVCWVGWHLHWTHSHEKFDENFFHVWVFGFFFRTKPHDDRPNQRTFEAFNISTMHQRRQRQRLKSFSSLHKHLAGSLSTYRKCYGFMGTEIPTYEQRQQQQQQTKTKQKTL